jgi:DNA repair protein RecO (recombination protein O)
MNQKRFTTRGVVLSRTNFGEADRILTFITPDHGKVKVIAKGSRKQKSKLAGGIEPFSISELTVLEGKGEIKTLMSSRLVKHFGNLTSELERLNAASSVIKTLSKYTEDDTETGYYELLSQTLGALSDTDLEPEKTLLWFYLHFLKQGGHQPNLRTDVGGQKLTAELRYNFDPEKMTFLQVPNGSFGANHIKLLRLALGLNKPQAIGRIQTPKTVASQCYRLAETMLKVQYQV